MIDYRAGVWGFHVAFGCNGSLAPRALAMAVPNALLTLLCATLLIEWKEANNFHNDDTSDAAQKVLGSFSVVMLFILQNRSRTSYSRWWEGGTLLQKTRGEWFNAFSSIMAFTSTKPEHAEQVEAYTHLLARLMSLLMCCGLQQVSPHRDRPFEIVDLDGIEPASMEFLNSAPDKVEIILQWIQRSMVLHVQTGVLPVAPPILSRAFQEVSRGIVNLQNARKIADFPYPYPLAQVSMILQILHWAMTPVAAALALPRGWAVLFSFSAIFVLWCIHFNALDLEFPFGTRVNDLPMQEMQQDWNKSVCTLLMKRAQRPPVFTYDPQVHRSLSMAMSDASELYVPTDKDAHRIKQRQSVATIKLSTKTKASSVGAMIDRTSKTIASAAVQGAIAVAAPPVADAPASVEKDKAKEAPEPAPPPPEKASERLQTLTDIDVLVQAVPVEALTHEPYSTSKAEQLMMTKQAKDTEPSQRPTRRAEVQEKLDEKAQIAWEKQLAEVGSRMKELHSCLVDEELRLMASLTRRAAEPNVVLRV